MAFGRRPKTEVWSINDHKRDQVASFKYLAVVLHTSGLRKAHCKYIADAGQKSVYYKIKLFKLRVVSIVQLLLNY